MAALENVAPAPGGGPVKCWRSDASKAKEKWGDEVKVTQAKKDLDTFPFPMAVSRAIPRPEAANTWEVWELKVKLVLCAKPASPEELDVKVEAATDGVLPDEVANALQDAVLTRWAKERKRALKAANKAATPEAPAPPYCFAFVELFTWCESNYVELLSVLPPFVNRFITEGATGGNEWHYCILEPKIPPPTVAPLTPEEQAAADEAEERRVEEALKEMQRMEIERKAHAEERRAAAELEGPKARQLSKKELEEAKKDKQGVRTAKTGSRATKHDPKAEQEKEKEEAKKKAEKRQARLDAAKAGGAVV